MKYKKLSALSIIVAICITATLVLLLATGTIGWKYSSSSPMSSVAVVSANSTTSDGKSISTTSFSSAETKAFSSQVIQWKNEVNVPNTLHMINAKYGWLISGSGIFRTADGGKSWKNVSNGFWSQIGNLSSKRPCVSFADETHAYIAFDAGDRESPEIMFYATDNGGQSWNQKTIKIKDLAPDKAGEGSGISTLNFLDATNGKMIITLDGGAGSIDTLIQSTKDGGKTWRTLSSGTKIPDGSMDFRFINQSDGFLFTNGSAYSSAILLSKDSGITWNSPVIFKYHYYSAATPTLSPILISSSSKIALLSCQNGKTPLEDTQKDWNGGSLSMFNIFYALNSNGTISNKKVELVTDFPLLSKTVSFPNGQLGFAIANVNGNTSLYKYTDKEGQFHKVSQENWMNQTIQVQFLNQSIGFCLTLNAVFATYDGGINWTNIALG